MCLLQLQLKTFWSAASDDPAKPVPLSEECKERHHFVASGGKLGKGVPLQMPPSSLLLYTNASMTSWVVHLHDLTTARV